MAKLSSFTKRQIFYLDLSHLQRKKIDFKILKPLFRKKDKQDAGYTQGRGDWVFTFQNHDHKNVHSLKFKSWICVLWDRLNDEVRFERSGSYPRGLVPPPPTMKMQRLHTSYSFMSANNKHIGKWKFRYFFLVFPHRANNPQRIPPPLYVYPPLCICPCGEGAYPNIDKHPRASFLTQFLYLYIYITLYAH